MVFGQIVNMATFFLRLVEMTVGAPTSHTKINVSLLLLKYTEPISNTLLVYQVTSMTREPFTLPSMNMITSAIIIQHMNTN